MTECYNFLVNYKKFKILVILAVLLVLSHFLPQFNKELQQLKTQVLAEKTFVSPTIFVEIKQTGRVLKVIDGDTVSVELGGLKQTIRVIGINSPEVVDPRKTVECFGRESSQRAKELLDNQIVTLESDPSQANLDRYGRLLRYVYLSDGTDFGFKMIEQGFAYGYTYDLPYKKHTEYGNAQNSAIEENEDCGVIIRV